MQLWQEANDPSKKVSDSRLIHSGSEEHHRDAFNDSVIKTSSCSGSASEAKPPNVPSESDEAVYIKIPAGGATEVSSDGLSV